MIDQALAVSFLKIRRSSIMLRSTDKIKMPGNINLSSTFLKRKAPKIYKALTDARIVAVFACVIPSLIIAW